MAAASLMQPGPLAPIPQSSTPETISGVYQKLKGHSRPILGLYRFFNHSLNKFNSLGSLFNKTLRSVNVESNNTTTDE